MISRAVSGIRAVVKNGYHYFCVFLDSTCASNQSKFTTSVEYGIFFGFQKVSVSEFHEPSLVFVRWLAGDARFTLQGPHEKCLCPLLKNIRGQNIDNSEVSYLVFAAGINDAHRLNPAVLHDPSVGLVYADQQGVVDQMLTGEEFCVPG